MSSKEGRFSIDPEAIADYRKQLRTMAQGSPIAEAAVGGYSDWQVIEAMERMWAAAGVDAEEPADTPPSSRPLAQ